MNFDIEDLPDIRPGVHQTVERGEPIILLWPKAYRFTFKAKMSRRRSAFRPNMTYPFRNTPEGLGGLSERLREGALSTRSYRNRVAQPNFEWLSYQVLVPVGYTERWLEFPITHGDLITTSPDNDLVERPVAYVAASPGGRSPFLTPTSVQYLSPARCNAEHLGRTVTLQFRAALQFAPNVVIPLVEGNRIRNFYPIRNADRYEHEVPRRTRVPIRYANTEPNLHRRHVSARRRRLRAEGTPADRIDRMIRIDDRQLTGPAPDQPYAGFTIKQFQARYGGGGYHFQVGSTFELEEVWTERRYQPSRFS